MRRAFCRPGSDLLSRVLRRSTISAGAFHGRVRNGIGCSRSAITTRSAKRTLLEKLFFVPGVAVFGRSPQARPRVRAFARPCPEASAKPTAARGKQPSGDNPLDCADDNPLDCAEMGIRNENDQADRTISTGKLQALPLFHTRPINVVVFHGSQGILVLRWVSRLDAFSGYPVRI